MLLLQFDAIILLVDVVNSLQFINRDIAVIRVGLQTKAFSSTQKAEPKLGF